MVKKEKLNDREMCVYGMYGSYRCTATKFIHKRTLVRGGMTSATKPGGFYGGNPKEIRHAPASTRGPLDSPREDATAEKPHGSAGNPTVAPPPTQRTPRCGTAQQPEEGLVPLMLQVTAKLFCFS